MKVKVIKSEDVAVKTLHVKAGVRYWEDASVNGVEDETGELIPCRDGEYWKPVIDLETGTILNWTGGVEADIHYKVCDDGIYTLKDENGAAIITIDDYVPRIMCPEENGYGDYIIMKVDADGKIKNWKLDLSDFEPVTPNPSGLFPEKQPLIADN